MHRVWTGAGLLATFIAAGVWAMPAPSDMPRVSDAATFGPCRLDDQLNPILRAGSGLVRSDLRAPESILWLRAMGVRAVLAPEAGKLSRDLEKTPAGNGWALFEIPQAAPRAVLVSRKRFDTLAPIRGPLDVEGLERYLLWAARPEAVGFERIQPDEIEIQADVGPDDLILVRVRAEPHWIAEFQPDEGRWAAIDWAPDPLGFIVLVPPKRGPLRVRLRYHAGWTAKFPDWRLEQAALDEGEFPWIAPDGVVNSSTYRPPPFRAGDHVAIFGERFLPHQTAVLWNGSGIAPSWVGPAQMNFKIPDGMPPGAYELRVVRETRLSYPRRIEVIP